MTWPRLTEQQKKDLARFTRYLREVDSKDLLTEYGTVSFDRLNKEIYDTFHVTPQKTPSGLTYNTAEEFAYKLVEGLRQTVRVSIEDKTDKYYDAHAVEQCGQWLKTCHSIQSYNQG